MSEADSRSAPGTGTSSCSASPSSSAIKSAAVLEDDIFFSSIWFLAARAINPPPPTLDIPLSRGTEYFSASKFSIRSWASCNSCCSTLYCTFSLLCSLCSCANWAAINKPSDSACVTLIRAARWMRAAVPDVIPLWTCFSSSFRFAWDSPSCVRRSETKAFCLSRSVLRSSRSFAAISSCSTRAAVSCNLLASSSKSPRALLAAFKAAAL
mmetsp:Transcript_29834/g.76614  ORF Transcript_29834/g.76614 Transcript_29834/m.76614 type:complete len:210 (+) Transcript_29834:710-1339(+)